MKKSFFNKVWILVITMVVLITTFVGCSDLDSGSDLQGSIFDSNISMVKNGCPELIPNITYEEAYSNFFANAKWRGFKADDGSDVVEFSGECTYNNEDAEVYIQFVIDDEESFSMYYAGITVGEEKFDADEKTFVELVYTPFATYSEEVLGVELPQDVQDAFAESYEYLN